MLLDDITHLMKSNIALLEANDKVIEKIYTAVHTSK